MRVESTKGLQTVFNFEKLAVWQKAMDLNDRVYQLTAGFPGEERFGLTNQIRRSAVSIISNIAEGASRSSVGDYARFVEIASGSLFELVAQLTVALRQNFLAQDNYNSLCSDCEEISKMLSGLRKSLLKS